MATRRSLLTLMLIFPLCLLLRANPVVQEEPPEVFRRQLGDDFVINIVTDGTYSIEIKGKTWLRNAPTFVNMYNFTHTAEGGSLKLIETDGQTGRDGIGEYSSTSFVYQAPTPMGLVKFTAEIKAYIDLPVIAFSQIYNGGCNWCQADSVDGVTAGFPGFRVEGPPDNLGFLSYGGMMFGDTEKHIGQWHNGTTGINDGISGGPLALFDVEGRTLIISAFDNFMSASFSYDKGNLYSGIMGGVSHIFEEYVQTTIMYYDTGINKAFDGWGRLLRTFYEKEPLYQQADRTITHLGYWTDNGAFYYYNTESDHNYEQTMLDVKDYADAAAIPYGYFQYDSWWYYKGVGDGVKTWSARPDIFPDGFRASDTTYAKQNGGKYDFIVEKTKALPLTTEFWQDLFVEAKKWGMILYEQDWLNVEFRGLEALLHNLTLGADWLNQMGVAARNNSLFIQYCMSNPRHAMQALIIPTVTQARVSDDYSPGKDQWKIGISSIFAEAMGVAPFKDTFWTTENQTDNPYHRSEPNWKLNTVVSVLSTGPVGPSDKIGHTNVPMLLKCCNNDGLILKPGHPARALDGQIIKSAFPDADGPTGEAWVAWSEISVLRFANLLLLNLEKGTEYTLYPKDLGVFINVPDGMVYAVPYDNAQKWSKFTSSQGITFTDEFTSTNFALYHFGVGIYDWLDTALLGNLDKWVPMSPQRVRSIAWTEEKVTAQLRGSHDEFFYFWYILHGSVNAVECTMDFYGEATLTIYGRNGTVTCL